MWAAGAALAGGLIGCGPDYPKCDSDKDCKDKEYCVNNLCQQCRGDADCGAGQQCAAGACQAIEGYCNSSSECGVGQGCQNNRCVTTKTASVPPPPATKGPCSLTAVYFEFDSSSLDSSSREQMANNAACIREKAMSGVHLTGLTDPRGTEEYNLALGDRRANAAKEYLESLGVQAKITHSSMGEEKASGEDDSGWSRDRRVDFAQ